MDASGAVGGANLALKFALELCAFAAFGYWGASTGSGAVRVLLAIVTPLAAIAVWSILAAPRARWRLPLQSRIPLELAVFTLACAALAAAGSGVLSGLLAIVVLVNALGLTAFHQWER